MLRADGDDDLPSDFSDDKDNKINLLDDDNDGDELDDNDADNVLSPVEGSDWTGMSLMDSSNTMGPMRELTSLAETKNGVGSVVRSSSKKCKETCFSALRSLSRLLT
jgi:hypothetical protein